MHRVQFLNQCGTKACLSRTGYKRNELPDPRMMLTSRGNPPPLFGVAVLKIKHSFLSHIKAFNTKCLLLYYSEVLETDFMSGAVSMP